MRRTAAVLTVAVLAAVASAPAAGAATRHVHQMASVVSELSLRGSGGYELDLVDYLGKGELLIASRTRDSGLGLADLPQEDVSYSVPAAASASNPAEGLLDVRIGRLGHFRGHLKVTSTEEEPNEPGCTGKPTLVEQGVFVGSFRFRGEAGYTRVQASRAHGSITRRSAQECEVTRPRLRPGLGGGRHGPAAKRPDGNLKLLASDLDDVFFEAEHRDEKKVDVAYDDFSASVSGSVGDVAVSHSVFLFDLQDGDPSPFAVPNLAEPLSEAVLAPPAPFTGTATFQSDGLRSGIWSGDLAVDLPGLPRTPLTGNGTEAGLCAGRAGCTETLPPALQPALEAPPGFIVTVAVKKNPARASRP